MKACRQGCPAKRSIVMKKRILSLFIITAMCFSIIGVTEEPAKAASKAIETNAFCKLAYRAITFKQI